MVVWRPGALGCRLGRACGLAFPSRTAARA